MKVNRVLLWYVLYFSGLRRLNWMKKDTHGVVFIVFRLSKYENPLISDISKHYSLFSSSLSKNEERLELTFLDSLKFNRKEKEEFFFWFSVGGSMSSLNITLSIFFDTHVSVFTFSSAITSSLLLLLLWILPGEYDHVSYMTDKSSCSIYKLQSCLGSSLCHAHCSRT